LFTGFSSKRSINKKSPLVPLERTVVNRFRYKWVLSPWCFCAKRVKLPLIGVGSPIITHPTCTAGIFKRANFICKRSITHAFVKIKAYLI